MATALTVIILILAFILLLRRQFTFGINTLAVAIICFLGVGSGFIASILLDKLQNPFLSLSTPKWNTKNAIIMLGAGAIKLPTTHIANPTIMSYSRIYETARLYFSCIKSHNECTIIVSGGDALKIGITEAMVYRKALIDLGINSNHIILEPNSLNTYQNAEFSSAILKQGQFNQFFLVTAGIHLRRSLLYFSHFGIHAQPIMADYLPSYNSLIPVGYNFAMADFAIHEFLGIIRLHVYDFLGWNKAVHLPGAL